MDRLWSPWRYTYLASSGPKPDCIFCAKLADADDERNYIVHRGERCFVLLNLYPYNNGHVMVAPYAHVATLSEADEATAADLMHLTRRTESVLREVYNAPGYNVGMNVGECAGAGVAGHIHMHVLPRWPGDVNFMTAIGETRVLPEDLNTTAKRLRQAFTAYRSG
jgi:ATP adenylyltransferase